MSNPDLYRWSTIRELSFAAFGMRVCDTCRACIHVDETHRDESGTYCLPCREQIVAEMEVEFAWMRPHVERANAACRAGDEATYEVIKRDVLRHDSPFDPRRSP